MLRLLLAVLFTLSINSHAAGGDSALGISWARCSKQVELIAELTSDNAKRRSHKEVGAVLHIYAVAAAGDSVVRAIRDETEAKFWSAMPRNHSNSAALRSFATKMNMEYGAEIKKCVASYRKHKPRFAPAVENLLKAEAKSEGDIAPRS